MTFRLNDVFSECPGVFASYPDFEVLLPGNLYVGDPFGTQGVVVASPECMSGASVAVAVVHLDYSGGECCIKLEEHTTYPRWVIDCEVPEQVDYYEIGWHGSIGGTCCPTGESGVDVRCEPQGSGNPSHPPTYWYEADLGLMDVMHDFRVRVYDPDAENYTNWIVPDEWTASIEHLGNETWAVWREGSTGLTHGFRFQFDNPNAGLWGHWELQRAFDTIRSGDMPGGADGCGYRVHVPGPATGVDPSPDEGSWGVIKALYR
jgi:hypothetical protein